MEETPNFIVIGAQKGGTTTLFHELKEEKNIFLPDKKELQYFSINYSKGDRWYSDQFKGKNREQISGEMTPFYLFYPKAAKRIHKHNARIKLIVLLRNPIERAISQYFHAKKRGFENLEILQALKIENQRIRNNGLRSMQKHSYISRSKYVNQLEKYYKYFGEEQLLVLKSEDMFNNMQTTKQIIGKHLQIKLENKINSPKKENSGIYSQAEIGECAMNFLKQELNETIIDIRKRYGIVWQ